MSRTRRFLSGVGFGYVGQALVMTAALWLTPFFLHRIGQHDYGLWLMCGQIIAYILLLDLGVVALIPRETAYATARADTMALARVVARAARIVCWQMPFVALAAAGVWWLIPYEWHELRAPLGVILATFVVVFPSRILQAVLTGLQDLGYLGAVRMAAWFGGVIVSVLFVELGAGLWGLAGGWIIVQVLEPVAWWWRMRTRWQNLMPSPLPAPAPGDVREHVRHALWVSIAQIAQALLQGTELVLIGRLLGPAAVVSFVCTGKLATVLGNQPQILMQAASPALSELKVAASREYLFDVSSAIARAMLLGSGAVVCAVLVVNEAFVGWWVGSTQYGGPVLTLLLLLAMLLRHWNTTTVYTVFCFGHERSISFVTLADGVVTVGASIFLIQFLGPVGAPLGSLTGVCFVSLPRNLMIIASDTDRSFRRLIRFHLPWAWRFALLVSGSAALSIVWSPTTLVAMMATAAVVSLVYGIVMLPLALRPPLGAYVVPQLLRARLRVRSFVPVPTKYGDV
jgi:O-antigen/teichoic acid export membrane protein